VRGAIQAAEQVQHRALAAAGSAHDGDKITFGKLRRHTTKRFDDNRPQIVMLFQSDQFRRDFH